MKRGEKIELIEKDDDFGDGWFLGRHLSKDDNGLFPAGTSSDSSKRNVAIRWESGIDFCSVVYTTLAPKPTSASQAVRRIAAHQAAAASAADQQSPVELMGDDNMKAPSVQPPPSYSHPPNERSFSAPLTSPQAPSTSSNANARPGAATMAQRSISMSNGAHQNSPVMNETLSVIEEHITDLSTPRHSLMPAEQSRRHDDHQVNPLPSRLSYIHGQETDEEESAALTAEEVLQWGPERVAEHLEDIGVDQKHCQVFREQEITGDVLLGMDQGSLMLKEFELGSIGKRLALWQKVKSIQEEVKTGVARRGSGPFASQASPGDARRDRSTSVGLPRIPSLMDGRTPSRQNSLQRSPTKSHPRYNDSTASMPASSEAHHGGHTPRPSAASVRDIAHSHSRRHSSIGEALASPTSRAPAESPIVHKHNKQGSFDTGWTMVQAPSTSSAHGTPRESSFQHVEPSSDLTTPGDNGMIVVSSLDLDRGYFSGNEVDNRNSGKLRKKHGVDMHGRAPSDSYGNKRLSAVFRSKRAGSTDSLERLDEPSATQLFYGKSTVGARSPSLAAKTGHRKGASVASPTVTKLDYGESPSIDAVTKSPHFAGSETSSIERASASKNLFSRTRATGLRAISDAITGDEKKGITSPKSISSEKGSLAKDSPLHSPGSSSPSINSKGFEGSDETALLKQSMSSGRQTPILPRRKGKKSTSAYTRGLEKKSPKEMIAGCDYSGWMKKKSSNLMTTWKTRLFVLRGTRLSYYYAEDDTEEKGLIDISFHRVLPANNDRLAGLHATFTGAGASPTSPQNAQIETTAAADVKQAGPLLKGDDSGMFIFKLVPPRAGLSKAVNFTKPTVHYFAVDNIQQGRLWMAALMKATIERDDAHQVITTYKEKTISLAKAAAMRQRPPALMGDSDEEARNRELNEKGDEEKGLRISYVNGDTDTATLTTNGDKEGSFTTGGATDSVNPSSENLAATPPVAS